MGPGVSDFILWISDFCFHIIFIPTIFSANIWAMEGVERGRLILGSPNICVYKIPLNKIHYKIHFNNSPSCIFCFYIVHLSKLVPRLHCLHAAVFVTCDVFKYIEMNCYFIMYFIQRNFINTDIWAT